MDTTILEYIAQNVGTDVLSDIKASAYRKSAILVLLAIPEGHFSLSELNYALRYIFGEKNAFTTHEEVRSYLKKEV